jgi:preprotein translocase subunit YajC
VNWLWLKIKQGAWRVVLAVVIIIAVVVFLYNLIRPSEDRTKALSETQTNIKTAIKENQIRATLEKDKIGIIKKIFEQKIRSTKKIEDREERLKALIRLHEELDL